MPIITEANKDNISYFFDNTSLRDGIIYKYWLSIKDSNSNRQTIITRSEVNLQVPRFFIIPNANTTLLYMDKLASYQGRNIKVEYRLKDSSQPFLDGGSVDIIRDNESGLVQFKIKNLMANTDYQVRLVSNDLVLKNWIIRTKSVEEDIQNPKSDDLNPKFTTSLENIFKYTNVIPKTSYSNRKEPVVYHSSWQTSNYNLGFNHQNFSVRKNEDTDGKYLKTYRIQQLLKNKKWDFNQETEEFTWSLDKKIIDEIIKTDKSASNIKLWLYLDVTDQQKSQRNPNSYNNSFYWTQIYNSSWYKLPHKGNVQAKNSWYDVGMEIPLNEILTTNNLKIKNDKYFDVFINYNTKDNKINFSIKKKPNYLGKFYEDYVQGILQNNGVFFAPHANFLNVSYLSDDNQNNTLFNHYQLPKQYQEKVEEIQKIFGKNQSPLFSKTVTAFDPKDPWKVNPNAFDRKTQELLHLSDYQDRKYEDGYINKWEQTASYNNFSLADEMRIRSFSAGGTWTMIAKVKPSDFKDQRYYVVTNHHVPNFKKNSNSMYFSKIGNDFFLKNYQTIYKNESQGSKKIGAFIDFEITNFLETSIDSSDNQKKVIAQNDYVRLVNNELYDNFDNYFDAKFGIVDLGILIPRIETFAKQNTDKNYTETYISSQTGKKLVYHMSRSDEEVKNLKLQVANFKSVLKDLQTWPKLSPLKWSKKYDNISKSAVYLVDWYANTYGSHGAGNMKINKVWINNQANDQYNSLIDKIIIITTETQLEPQVNEMVSAGTSGSLIVDSDRNMIGLIANEVGRGNGKLVYAHLLRQNMMDFLGFGPDDHYWNNPKIINDTSLKYLIKKAHEKNPDKFELFPEWFE